MRFAVNRGSYAEHEGTGFSTGHHRASGIHAYYQDAKAVVDLNSCEITEGDFPRKQAKMLLAWTEIHHEELMADWDLASKGELPFKIEPLR